MSIPLVLANRFKVEDLEKSLLGVGGMGSVYRGVDTRTGKPVAIKALIPEIVAGNPEMVARFKREGEILRKLNHPNIVKVLASLKAGKRSYLVMEFFDGGSLRDLLQSRNPPSLREKIEIALDLADALTHAHRLGVIHRDIKPANVLLGTDGIPRLTDFGIAHIGSMPRLTMTGTMMGTIDYLSPEACQGEQLDPRADIWSFGIMLYEMLTGECPFTKKNIPSTITAILNNPLPNLEQLAPGTPSALHDLIRHMLEKDRQKRIPSIRRVGAELEEILLNLPDEPGAAGTPAVHKPELSGRFQTPPGKTDSGQVFNLPEESLAASTGTSAPVSPLIHTAQEIEPAVEDSSRLSAALATLTQRWPEVRAAVLRQALYGGIGAGAALAVHGIFMPFYLAISAPALFREGLQVFSLAAWSLSAAFAMFVVGVIQGAGAGAVMGSFDAVATREERKTWRYPIGALAGLLHALYQIIFSLLGLLSPEIGAQFYIPLDILYGLVVGLSLVILTPPLGRRRRPGNQFFRWVWSAILLILATLPYIFLVYRQNMLAVLIDRTFFAALLTGGYGLGITRLGRKADQKDVNPG